MHTKRVLGIDPGDTTGYAFADVIFDQDKWALMNIFTSEATYPLGIRDLVACAVNVEKPEVIVIEDYIIRQPHFGQSPIAIKVIGVLQVNFCTSTVQVVLQQPVEKARFPNTRLSKKGIDPKHKSLHEMDALRHIAIWAQKEARRESRP